MINQPHPILDFLSLLVILIGAINYGLAGVVGKDFIASIDPWPPTCAVVIGLCGVWQALRQQYL